MGARRVLSLLLKTVRSESKITVLSWCPETRSGSSSWHHDLISWPDTPIYHLFITPKSIVIAYQTGSQTGSQTTPIPWSRYPIPRADFLWWPAYLELISYDDLHTYPIPVYPDTYPIPVYPDTPWYTHPLLYRPHPVQTPPCTDPVLYTPRAIHTPCYTHPVVCTPRGMHTPWYRHTDARARTPPYMRKHVWRGSRKRTEQS